MSSFLDRLLGIHRAPIHAEVIVIPGSSVHGLTLARPLTHLAIKRVAGPGYAGTVEPARFVRIRGAIAIAEFPGGLICQADHDLHHIRWLR